MIQLIQFCYQPAHAHWLMMLMRSWKARANPTAATSQDSGKAVHFDTV